MGQALTDKERQEIVNQHYLGHTNPQIAKNTGRSTGTISNVISDHTENLSQGNSDDVINRVRNFKKNNLTLRDASTAVSISKKLHKMNITPDQLDQVLQAVQTFQDVSPLELFNIANQLYQLQNQTKIPLHEIPSHYQTTLDKNFKLKSENTKLQSESKKLQADIKAKLYSKKITEKRLEEFEQTKKFLENIGLNMTEHERLAHLFKNSRANNYNISEIINHLSKEKSYEVRILELEKDIQSKEIDSKHNQTQIEKQNKVIKSNESLVNTINKFATNKITPEELELFYAEIIHYSTKHKVSLNQALKVFYQDLPLYDKHLGLQNQIKQLQEQSINIKSELTELESRKEEETSSMQYLESERRKIDTEINQMQDTHLRAIKKHDKEMKDSLQYQHIQFKKTLEKFESVMMNAVASYKKENSNIISSTVKDFEKHITRWVESLDKLGNLQTLKKLNELFDGELDKEEADPLMFQIINGYRNLCKKERNTDAERCSTDLLRTILSTI